MVDPGDPRRCPLGARRAADRERELRLDTALPLPHLAPKGRAGFVMANGSLTTMTSGEGKIRESLIRADVVDCIVALPAQLFYTTGIPVCLWFLDRDKTAAGTRDRRGETLFIDARQLGRKISRTQIALTD